MKARKMTAAEANFEELAAQGYRRVSNKYGIVSRIDRPDWLIVMAKMGYYVGPATVDGFADTYRREHSQDWLEFGKDLPRDFPGSGHDSIGYVPLPTEKAKGGEVTPAAIMKCLEENISRYVDPPPALEPLPESERVWTTRDGRKLKVSEMENDHLLNAYRMLKRNNFVSPKTLMFYLYGPEPSGDMSRLAWERECDEVFGRPVSSAVEWFEDEIKRRGLEEKA